MPLRVAKGIPIRPSKKRMMAAAAIPSVTLPVPYVRQEQTQWCWAACAQMVANYLGNTNVRQCELANALHGQSRCCQQPASPGCNEPSPYDGIAQVYGHLRVNCISHTWPVSGQVVVRELTAGRPVEIGLLWSGGGGHVAVVRGCTPQGLFAVHDPWFGSGLATYLNLYTAYGRGQWAYSFGDFRNL
jgi:hypothetical protein